MRRITALGWPTIALATVVAVVAAACYAVKAPPVPSAERVPTVIGQIVAVTAGQAYQLSNGESVAVRDAAGSSIREQLGSDAGFLPESNGPEGGLILAGQDANGEFYAATRSPRGDGCFEIRGPGYLQLDRKRVHLSTGLVLELADDVRVLNDRPANAVDPSWLFETDDICLDAAGVVTSIHQEALGA